MLFFFQQSDVSMWDGQRKVMQALLDYQSYKEVWPGPMGVSSEISAAE